MSETDNASITILAVDDDPDALFILDRLLCRQGYRVKTATGGHAAIAALEQSLVDVIVLDVMMPDLDGLQVCAALRQDERTRAIPVILLTASVHTETRLAAMGLGVTEFVTKPLNSRDLLARIRAQLHQRKLVGEIDRTLAGDLDGVVRRSSP
ncbi:MAG: response regulator [Candidatus Binatia bacterium]